MRHPFPAPGDDLLGPHGRAVGPSPQLLGRDRPSRRPHTTPVWGLWVDRAFYFGAGPRTRKACNLAENPNVAVHLESGDDVVILEGAAEVVTDPDPGLGERLFLSSSTKNGTGSRDVAGSYVVRPRVVFAWSAGSPRTFTRWMFDQQPPTRL